MTAPTKVFVCAPDRRQAKRIIEQLGPQSYIDRTEQLMGLDLGVLLVVGDWYHSKHCEEIAQAADIRRMTVVYAESVR